jgi:hypothetical protein
MAVVMAGFGGAGHLLHGDDASIEDFAVGVLKLDRGVADVVVVLEHVVEFLQDAGALRRRDVVDGDVAG